MASEGRGMGRGCNWLFLLAETLQLYSSGRGLFPACGKDSTEGTPQGFMERSGGSESPLLM